MLRLYIIKETYYTEEEIMTTIQRSPSLEGKWPEQGEWTYEDYARLPENGWRYEVIEGVLYMAPAPNTRHQRAINVLSYGLTDFVEKRQLGRIYTAPIDVILPDRATPVQPDILFIAQERLDIITEQTIEGPPDLVVEVLSPGNWIIDRQIKSPVYETAGVQEYWIVDVHQGVIEVYDLHDRTYEMLGRYTGDETAASRLLPGFTISVNAVCES